MARLSDLREDGGGRGAAMTMLRLSVCRPAPVKGQGREERPSSFKLVSCSSSSLRRRLIASTPFAFPHFLPPSLLCW
ncbi:hypothetical protein VFPFJ_03533 [Purpureocillium lilacinum]|uniref:Uncharacterized protein n=1 Tax=Purpureocillium lilacinum TaxID=33203 RepID=A0A179HR19_PURLI|nr:hypothetical protein VFPFJ_03533 [Purpureocillium lilacinum]OAQ91793.1 hypothetical protein VFPFJ_03533 [Purpureocillium lilacinum]